MAGRPTLSTAWTRRSVRRGRAALVGMLVAGVLGSSAPGVAGAEGEGAGLAGAEAPSLSDELDAVVALSPSDTCLVVSIEGEERYAHRPDDLQVPASTQKLITSSAALERFGADRRFRTSVVSDAPVSDGVVRGDVVLVGGGDPTVVTSIYRAIERLPDDQPTTLLDALARRLREAGVVRIEGRVLGDERLFDAERSVPSWPPRFVAQGQAGPLSALSVDDGHLLEPVDGGFERVRSADPPSDAARALVALLAARGIEVAGGWGAGPAPEAARPLAAIESPPLDEVVADVLRRSDNHGAELLLKHLGVEAAGEGSTAAGAQAVAGWTRDAGVAADGSFVADGSGLDPTNLVSCRELVAVLDRSGPDGLLAEGLPVAGRTGTLTGRFREGSAEGRLRAKTGRLNGVSALAGFVDLRDGTTATFAYVANAQVIGPEVLRAQDFLAEILGRYVPPCPQEPLPEVVLPPTSASATLVQAAVLAGGGGPGAVAATVAALDGGARRASLWLDRCSRAGGVAVVAGGR